MHKSLLTVLIFLLPVLGFSQLDNQKNWQIGYYGDVVLHPGVQIGYEMPLRTWVKTKSTKKGETSRYKSWNFGTQLAYYYHPRHHHGLILSPNLTYRRTVENGKFFSIKLAMGLHRSFVDGPTYEVDDQGGIEQLKGVGQMTQHNSLSFSFGKDLRQSSKLPLRYYWQVGINGKLPYNHSFLPGIHFGAGIHYFLNFKT